MGHVSHSKMGHVSASQRYQCLKVLNISISHATHKRKSLDVDLRLIAKNIFCSFDLLVYWLTPQSTAIKMSGR